MRVATLLVAVVLLAGCTRVLDVSGNEWRRANTSIQQVTYDEVECARASEHVSDMPWTIVGGIVDMVVVPLGDKLRGASYDRCMRKAGYEHVAGAAPDAMK
jgi:uncharacterized protein YceK